MMGKMRPILYLVLLLSICSGIAGCSGKTAAPRLETLHLAGVTDVASVYDLLDRSDPGDFRLVGSVMLPDPTGARASYLAFALKQDLYVVLPDGRDLHVIFSDMPCYLPAYGAFFSPDGNWLACTDRNTNSIQMAQLPVRGAHAQWRQLAVTGMRIGWTLSWAPDGQQLIVPSFDLPCLTAIFAVSATHDQVRLVKTLTFPTFVPTEVNQKVCDLVWADWSPDGQYLAVSHLESLKPTYYVIPLARLGSGAEQGSAAPTVSMPAEALLPMGAYDVQRIDAAVWSTQANILNDRYQGIIEVPVPRDTPRVLLNIPFGPLGEHLCTLGSVVNSRLIAFTYCYTQIIDEPRGLVGPGVRLFVFDPSTAQ
jgi:hypothetical protein